MTDGLHNTFLNYQNTLRKVPEEWRLKQHRGGSLKSRDFLCFIPVKQMFVASCCLVLRRFALRVGDFHLAKQAKPWSRSSFERRKFLSNTRASKNLISLNGKCLKILWLRGKIMECFPNVTVCFIGYHLLHSPTKIGKRFWEVNFPFWIPIIRIFCI